MSGGRRNKREIGSIYEGIAADFLEQKGYRILERNYQNRYGEIDLIAVWNDCRAETEGRKSEDLLYIPGTRVVFCEVKYRMHRGTGDPAEAVTAAKIRHICRVAVGFYMEYRLTEDFPCRFDVISILGNGEIRHIEDAFPAVY